MQIFWIFYFSTILVLLIILAILMYAILIFPYKMTMYHGGCIGCSAQSKFGKKYCKGCQYHKCNWDLPCLHDNKSFYSIYHGGCQGCNIRQLKGLPTCVGCCYYACNWDLPNLNSSLKK